MPARVVVVLDDADLTERTVETLLADGIDALTLPSSMVALDALEASQRIELLVTCPQFANGPPYGIALARMARLKRPGVEVVFVGSLEFAHLAEGLSEFLPTPTTVDEVTSTVTRLLMKAAVD
jgi:hypothetical protein